MQIHKPNILRLALLCLGVTWVVNGFTNYNFPLQLLGYACLAGYLALEPATRRVGRAELRSDVQLHGSDPIVGITPYGDLDFGCAVTASGDTYSHRGSGAWEHDGNIYALAGQMTRSPIIGCTDFDSKVLALSADGRLFASGGGGFWWLEDTLGGGPYTAFGSHSLGAAESRCLLAVQENGDVVTVRSVGSQPFPSGNVLVLRTVRTESG